MTSHEVELYWGCIISTPSFGALDVFEHGGIAVDVNTGRIILVLSGVESTAHRQSLLQGLHIVREVRLEDQQFLLAGFIDTHIHAPQYPNAGTGLDLPLMKWLDEYTFPSERGMADEALAATVYRRVISRTLAHGTTTSAYYATIHLNACKILADAALRLGQRAFVGLVCMDRHAPADYVQTTTGALHGAEQLIEHIRQLDSAQPEQTRGLVNPILTPRFVPTCSLELMKGLSQLAAKWDVPMQTHAVESIDEVEFSCQLHPDIGSGRDPAILDHCGVLRPGTVLAHAVHLTREEEDLLLSRGCGVAHCPLSNAYFAGGVLRARLLAQKGLPVGLGSDISGGYAVGILPCIRAALMASRILESGTDRYHHGTSPLLSKPPGSCEDSHVLTVPEALFLATLGGARALGIQSLTGSLEAGKMFDALLVDMAAPGNIDLFGGETKMQLLEKFVHLGDDRNIVRVFVQGRDVKPGFQSDLP